jgi:cyclopropane-fatty-acyl-phospholipid synthase
MDGQAHETFTHRVGRLLRADRAFAVGDGLMGKLLARAPQALLDMLDARLTEGGVTAVLPDGTQRRCGYRAPGPDATVVLHNWRPIRRLMIGGHVGWAKAYIDGDWDSPDLAALFELFTLNRKALGEATHGKGLLRTINRLAHGLRANTRAGSRKNISFHYDLGNAFYQEWLDPTMTYSSAIYAEGDNSLEQAQVRKVRRLLDSIGLKAGDHLLEIGCGWGALAEIAARDYGARVTGVTLSQEQFDYATARIANAGLSDLVTFEIRDYRDVNGTFDHIASVEMFEAVGERYWRTFMDKVHSLLKPGGKAGLQVITIDEETFHSYRRSADFIQTYIFPGGMLPSVPVFRRTAEAAGLAWDNAAFYGQHYARTLNEWGEAFAKAIQDGRLPKAFDETFQRIWTYYLTYCEGGFRAGGIDVMQVALARR